MSADNFSSADIKAIPFDNSYARQPPAFYERAQAARAPSPRILRINETLARQLQIDPAFLNSAAGLAVLSGIGLRPGSRFAFNAAAQGKVVLAFGPPHIATRVYDNPLPRVTPRTITKAAVLTDEIRRCREDGWAEAPDELFLGINALAAPLFYPDRSLMGTLAIVGFTEALRGSKRKKALRKLISTAAEISASLAGPDRPDPV